MLAENGFSLGKNLQLVDRYAEGRLERLPLLAREIAAARVDVVLAITGDAVRAMLAANQETPIVMIVGYDPVALGLLPALRAQVVGSPAYISGHSRATQSGWNCYVKRSRARTAWGFWSIGEPAGVWGTH